MREGGRSEGVEGVREGGGSEGGRVEGVREWREGCRVQSTTLSIKQLITVQTCQQEVVLKLFRQPRGSKKYPQQ